MMTSDPQSDSRWPWAPHMPQNPVLWVFLWTRMSLFSHLSSNSYQKVFLGDTNCFSKLGKLQQLSLLFNAGKPDQWKWHVSPRQMVYTCCILSFELLIGGEPLSLWSWIWCSGFLIKLLLCECDFSDKGWSVASVLTCSLIRLWHCAGHERRSVFLSTFSLCFLWDGGHQQVAAPTWSPQGLLIM